MQRKAAMRKVFDKALSFPIELLSSPDRIVQHCFIVHRSLLYLDLSRCELSSFGKKEKRKQVPEIFRGTNNFVCTEESCRKELAPNRKVLYNFHLDVSKDLEHSLKNASSTKISKCCSNGILLSSLGIFREDLYDSIFTRIILETLEQTNDKVRLIHHVSKLAKHKGMKFISENQRIRHMSLTYLCFQRPDVTVVEDFLTVMDFDFDHFFTFSVHVFEFVLQHANLIGHDLWRGPACRDPIHTAIKYGMFVKTESLFQYRDAPKFCEKMHDNLQDSTKWSLTENSLTFPEESGLLSRERHLLILEILLVFSGDPSKGLKALQMVWRSIPDPFINLDELTLALAKHPNPEMTTKMSSFIKKVTGEDILEESGHQPRKLKHYCRIVIRGVLSNNRQLSSGINQLKLPTKLKSFLKLEN